LMRERARSGWRSREAGFLVLIELLIVVLIIGVLAAFYLTSGGGAAVNPKGGPTTMPGKAREQAESAVCRNNLQQLRAAIGTQLATTGENPPDLASLSAGVSTTCPVGEEEYVYDPSTGQVSCAHPGHEGY
jgi:hypothetical protein